MRRFAFLSVAVCVLSFGVVLAAFAHGSSETSGAAAQPTNKKITMTYWYPWGGGSQKWDLWRIGQFEKKYPNIKVHAVYVPPDSGLSNGKMLAAIAGHSVPDLAVAVNPSLAYSLATQGALSPIGPALKKAGFKQSAVLAPFVKMMQYQGKTYLFPQDSNVNLMFYNTNMLKAAGLDPSKLPKTIAELNVWAKKLTKYGSNGKVQTLGLIPWVDQGTPIIWGWMWGVTFYNPKTNKLDFANQKMVNMFEWMRSYAVKYGPQKVQSFVSGFGGLFSPDHPFYTGKIAMDPNGNWMTHAIHTYAPNVKYTVGQLPAPPGGRPGGTVFGTNVFIVPKGAKQVEAAAKFMLFGSQAQILTNDIDTWRAISIWRKVNPEIKWVKQGDPIYRLELNLAQSHNSGQPALTAVAPELTNQLNLIRDKVIYSGADPMPLLKALQKKLQAKLD